MLDLIDSGLREPGPEEASNMTYYTEADLL